VLLKEAPATKKSNNVSGKVIGAVIGAVVGAGILVVVAFVAYPRYFILILF
jgi:hypothetical protein